MWTLAYFLTGLALAGVTLRIRWPTIQQTLHSNTPTDPADGPDPGFIIVVQLLATIFAWPAVAAVWIGWQLAPPVKRLGERISGRRTQPSHDPGHSGP
jgi:hypothetical protein